MYSVRGVVRPAVAVFLMLSVAGMAAAAPKFQEGQWEYRVRIEMPGMQMQMPATTYSQCVTKKDLVPQMPQADCDAVSHKVKGDTVTWTAKCRDKEKSMTMESTGTVTYKENAMEGTIKNTMSMPGQATPIRMVNHISGKRTGACKK